MIETLLTLGAITAIAAAVYLVLGPTSASAQTKIEQDNLRHLSAAVDKSFGLLGSFSGVSTARIVQDDLAPRRMRDGDDLRTAWGTVVDIDPYAVNEPGDAFLVAYPLASSEVCARLASAMARDAYDIRVNGSSVYDAQGMSPSIAAQRCAAGNASMEFVFHSGLVSGQSVAAGPVELPPPPPTTTTPSTPPPVISIPPAPGVDPVGPGTPAEPPPAPEVVDPDPVAPEPSTPPPPPEPPPVTAPLPPPDSVAPGVMCSAPGPVSVLDSQTLSCPSGQLGAITQERTGTRAYSCSEAWGEPVPAPVAWGGWSTTGNTCAPACVAPAQSTTAISRGAPVQTRDNCPAGHTGSTPQRRTGTEAGTRTTSWTCPAPTGSPTRTDTDTWSGTYTYGNWTANGTDTCAAAPPPSCASDPPVFVSLGSASHSIDRHRLDPTPIPGYYPLPDTWSASAPGWVKSALSAAKSEVAGQYSPAVHGSPPYGYNGPGGYGLTGGTGGFCLEPGNLGGVHYWYLYMIFQVGPGMGSGGDVFRHTWSASFGACMSACEAEAFNP